MAGTRPAWIVLDIEGTTSATRSVRTGLYEYARPRLGAWIDAHPEDPEVRDAVAQVRAEAGLAADAGTADVVVVLRRWMDGDVKATPLKTLQGQVWAAGFAGGELTAHFFPDVPPALRAWHAAGTRLAVFSSGSARAQRPWFRHAEAGDLASLVDGFFDTVNAGPKRETASYRRIAGALGAPAGAVLFLSDVPAELDAAAEAGWRTTGVRRPGEPSEAAGFGRHRVVASFAELDLEEPR
ncbi:enolase-phosphatase E1 [Sphaerisporangium krabiense]|uniref:acireductone synthase n=1 Tax=Sphaerisporangium krabiense TaxID=763782 RepID=UPI00195009FC|nr:acireductone synthase [Sphaerisporangium krabiense]GII60701.1 enolase-phosphatase E1 [Sphaerisporangium krabiense]